MNHSAFKSKPLLLTAFIFLIFTILFVAYLYHGYVYPYGNRHCTLQCMFGGLVNYALEHEGSFPNVENDPYLSLTQLYPRYCTASELAGVSGKLENTERVLKQGKPLDQDSTSWVYVCGLRQRDDPRLAILWEMKTGLYSNGRRSKAGGRAVLLISGSITNVGETEWHSFLTYQQHLRLSTTGQQLNSPGPPMH